MRRYIVLFAALYLLGACGGEPTPTPDLVATQIAIEKAAHATMTAEAPTSTKMPTHTATSTNTPTSTASHTPSPSPTLTRTATPTPTFTPTETATSEPTATATTTPRPKPTSTPMPELEVAYRDFHYECQGYTELTQGRPPYETVSGYRSFQALMVITNLTKDRTLEPPWMPDRWIVTDGQTEWDETYAWQWTPSSGPYPLPAIGPGATASWTWLCYPLPEGAWVKAAEFTAWGHTYRFEFPKPNYGDFNYYDCP